MQRFVKKKQKAQKLGNCYEYTREILSRHTHTHKHTVEEQTLVEFWYCFMPVVLFFLTRSPSFEWFCVFYVYHCVSPHAHMIWKYVCVHSMYTVYCWLHSRMPILPMPIKLTIKLYVNIAWLYRIQIKHMHIKSHNGFINDSSADNCWIYTVSVSVSITRILHTCTGCAQHSTTVYGGSQRRVTGTWAESSLWYILYALTKLG